LYLCSVNNKHSIHFKNKDYGNVLYSKKGCGKLVKSLADKEKAQILAAKCNKVNNTDAFVVCKYEKGMMMEI
jgi:hypothetical protein